MLGVDSNVVVRLLTEDEPVEAARARKIFERNSVLLVKTVLLETEWILLSLYGFQQSRIADSFVALIGLPNVLCEDISSVRDAIEWTRKGMDLADAMHLACARPARRFATFDRKLVRQARGLTDIAVVQV